MAGVLFLGVLPRKDRMQFWQSFFKIRFVPLLERIPAKGIWNFNFFFNIMNSFWKFSEILPVTFFANMLNSFSPKIFFWYTSPQRGYEILVNFFQNILFRISLKHLLKIELNINIYLLNELNNNNIQKRRWMHLSHALTISSSVKARQLKFCFIFIS